MITEPSVFKRITTDSLRVKILVGRSVKDIQRGIYKADLTEEELLWLLKELHLQNKGTQLLYRVHAKYNTLRVKREQKELGGLSYEK